MSATPRPPAPDTAAEKTAPALGFDGVTLDAGTIGEHIQTWVNAYVLSIDTAIQIAAIVGFMTLGGLIGRLLKPSLTRMIESLRLSVSLRGVLHNLRRLTGPIVSMAFLFFFRLAIASSGVGIYMGLVEAAMHLIAAWVIVSLFVQLVGNPHMRTAVAAIVWCIAALSILGVLDDTARALDSVGMNFGEFRLSALTAVKGVLAILALLYAAMSASRMIDHQVQQAASLSMAARILISKIARFSLIIIAVITGIAMAGIDISHLAIFTGAIGLGIGFGLQRGVSNIFTGMMLLLDRSIQPGDVIELPNGTFGVVESMGTRCTEVVTRDNKSYLIPNEDLVTHQVVNWSRGDTLIRLDVEFGVDYAHNPHDIVVMAAQAAKGPERVLTDPAPICHFKGFGDSALKFTLRFWIKDAENGITNIKSEVLLSLWSVLMDHGIKIPYPHREIIMHKTA